VIQRGDRVLYLQHDMPGEIVGLMDGDYQIAWAEDYDSPLSGGTFWGGAELLAAELVEIVGKNGHEPRVPETLIDPRGRDLFAEAGRMVLFEL
jgi:hypothetical protein